MAWYKCRSIFDIAKIANFFLIIPNMTITKSGQAKTKLKDYAICILFQLYAVLCIFFAFHQDLVMLSGSRVLDIGITVPYKIGSISVLIGKFIIFARRQELWKIYLLLRRCDQEVLKGQEKLTDANFNDFLLGFQIFLLKFYVTQLRI